MSASTPSTGEEQRVVALVGEPEEWILRSLATVLSPHGFEVLQARSGREVLDQANVFRPDLILLSDALRDVPVREVLRRLHSLPSFTLVTPVFVTTSQAKGDAERIENLRAGAWDTIILPANPEELVLRLRRFAEAKIRSDVVQGEGILDTGTGFYTLQGVLRRTEEESTEAWRHKRPLGCVMLGPSRDVSQVLGEEDGSGALRELERKVADFLRRSSRRSDILGRLTHSEFIVVAPDTDEGGTVTLAGRLLSGLEDLTLEAESRGELPIEMCAGLFSSAPAETEALEPMDLLSRATVALRRSQAAHQGRERMVRWSSDNGPIPADLANGVPSPG